MTMNAAPAPLMDLLSSSNTRYEIPVYQRPYSWGADQCDQLWQDILTVGKRRDIRHFTGSVVCVMDGSYNPAGITTSLIIDGQQRMTTVSLLVAALADFARDHTQGSHAFSREEIIDCGYLVNKYKSGEDHYRLTLSQSDKGIFRALVDAVEHNDLPLPDESSRIVENFSFFRHRIEHMEDPDLVWNGLKSLDVVSISLDSGKDNPQLIFESMNSTGKDLSSADLIRNYVLMGLEREQQEHMYVHHWRKIEETLGLDSYDEIFDEFVRNYLTVLYAPEPLTRRNVYPIFKRHVISNDYDRDGKTVELLCQMEEFASYYANITMGRERCDQLKVILDNIAKLNASVVNPLLLSMYDDHAQGAFTMDDFVAMAKLLESYILRRSVVDAPANSLNKFFLTLMGRLGKIQKKSGNYREAFESFLLAEAGTNRRFPTDEEFSNSLLTRDAYHFRRCFYLLRELELMHHPKDTWNLDQDVYTIEHVMPQNALAHEEWTAALSNDERENFELICNNLGNLTLTAYNSELSDGTFEEKKARIVGGYDKECLVISKAVKDATIWTPQEIENRAIALAKDAVKRWGYPTVTRGQIATYSTPATKLDKSDRTAITLSTLVEAGFLSAGTVLVPASAHIDMCATVGEDGTITLSNGEVLESPSKAAVRASELTGNGSGARNGWRFWRIENGPVIDGLRSKLAQDNPETDRSIFLSTFWTGFYEYCEELPGFIETFGSKINSSAVKDHWSYYGLNIPGVHLEALVGRRDGYVGVQIWFAERNIYAPFIERKTELESNELSALADQIEWGELDANRKTRLVIARHSCDLNEDSPNDLYPIIADWMWKMRRAVLRVFG